MIGTKRFAPLDGLRGIAVLMVFLSHTSGRGILLHSDLNFTGIGHIGVYLFFCLSAYLLGSRLLDKKINWLVAKQFFIKRVFRIWPLYFLVLIAVLILQNVFGYYNSDYLFIKRGWLPAIQHFVFYRGDSVFWSVVAEEQFYILVPALLFGYQKRPRTIVTICILVVAVNYVLYISKHTEFPFVTNGLRYISTNARENGNYLDVFLGSLLMLFAFKAKLSLFQNKTFHLFSTVLFVVTLVGSVLLVSQNLFGLNQPAYLVRYHTLLFVIGFMPFILSLESGNKYVRVLNNPMLRKIGLYGFSYYLLHFFVFNFINEWINIASELKFGLAFILVHLVSMASYNFIEKPFITLGYKLAQKQT